MRVLSEKEAALMPFGGWRLIRSSFSDLPTIFFGTDKEKNGNQVIVSRFPDTQQVSFKNDAYLS